ncbi:MAG: ferritin-like domain-containing protein [Acidobacteria bacterium]|nr:ferritin-like domain-containing protein [Acidobacteriota bacterium]
MTEVDLADLRFEEGAHLLLARALGRVAVGEEIAVRGRTPDLDIHLRAWARAEGHGFGLLDGGAGFALRRGPAQSARWQGAEQAGRPDPALPGAVVNQPPSHWGLAARGATVEAGALDFRFTLAGKSQLWADEAARLYAQAVASQWNPHTAVDWNASFELPEEVEDAVVQLMTYLIENETAALVVPSRFVAQMHPHFREVLQLLAIQAADEARHIEVFTRRATLKRDRLGLSTVGGQASLKTLVDEPDFAVASFLLSVMGEGTFLTLLRFLERHAPDPVTRAVTALAAADEARHVAFGVAHLRESALADPFLLERLAASVHRRHEALRHTAGLNQEVRDALVLLAAGGWEHKQLRLGSLRVAQLLADMDVGRRNLLRRLGFDDERAAALSGLHTRNFM